jgi:hypothetical protein
VSPDGTRRGPRNQPAAVAAFTTPHFLTGESKTSVFSHSPRPKSAPSRPSRAEHTEAPSQYPPQITCELRSTQNEALRSTVCFGGPKTKREAQSPKDNEARSAPKPTREAQRAHLKWPANTMRTKHSASVGVLHAQKCASSSQLCQWAIGQLSFPFSTVGAPLDCPPSNTARRDDIVV